MPGRVLLSEAEVIDKAFVFDHPACARRRAVLRETLDAFLRADPPGHYHQLASLNLERWYSDRQAFDSNLQIHVLAGDWGEVALGLTKRYGTCFAVLNMANSLVPGGAYVEGAVAQEENMFRRTDCHFRVEESEYDAGLDRYVPEMTRLLTAKDGRVYLDTKQARVCIRGPEDRYRDNLGYQWLDDDDVFPFFELRASAQDLRDGSRFNVEEARRRIAAQLDTLHAGHVRHAVLSAFGCGAFLNPAERVAALYREEIDKRRSDFSVIGFAIFAPGYGPDNHTPFLNVFQPG